MSVGPITLILNASAAADPPLREAVGSLRTAGCDVTVHNCWEDGDPARFAQQATAKALADGAAADAVLVAAGGDGTVNEVAAALAAAADGGKDPGELPALAVAPYGTANDFATAAGLPVDDPARCLLSVPDLTVHRCDIGRLNGRPFVNAASAGYAARVTTEADPTAKKLLGGLAYWYTGLRNLSRTSGAEVTVAADDAVWTGRVLAVVVGNGRYAGGGIAVTPHARIDDGKLEVTIVPEVGVTEYKALYDDLARVGQGEDPQLLTVGRAERVLIEAETPIQVNLDGEPVTDTRLEFDVLPGAIRVLLPATSPLLSPPPVGGGNGPFVPGGVDHVEPADGGAGA